MASSPPSEPPPRASGSASMRGSLVALFTVQGVAAAYLLWLLSLAIRDHVWLPGRFYRAPYYHILCVVDWLGAVAGLAALALAFLAPPRRWIGRIVSWLDSHLGWTAAAVAGGCAILSLTAHHGYPLTMDEYAPAMQAEIFARGRVVGQWPPNLSPFLVSPEFWITPGFLCLSQNTGEVCSDYLPGHALLLAPFTWLGVPWALNPSLAAASVLLMGSLARRLYGPPARGWAVLLTIASPVFTAYGISFYAMMAHCTANLLFARLLVAPTPLCGLGAGMVGGFALVLHNPFPHAVFALPWLAWLAASRRRLPTLAAALCGYAVVFVPLDAGWNAVEQAVRTDRVVHAPLEPGGMHETGSPDAADHRAAAPPRGNPGSATLDRWAAYLKVLRFENLTEVALLRWSGFVKLVAWDAPGLVVLACLGAWLRRDAPPVRLLAASAVTTFCGYALVAMSGGHGWGYRYFFSAWGCLPLLAAGGTSLLDSAGEGPSRDFARRIGLAAVTSIVVILPARLWQIEHFVRAHVAQRPPPVAVGGPGDDDGFAVTFLDPRDGYYRSDLIRNHPFLEAGPYVLASQGEEIDERVVAEMARALGMTHRRAHMDERGSTWVVEPPRRSPTHAP